MGASRHPVALRPEQQVGGATRLLAAVTGSPPIDGIFPALIIAGALTTTAGSPPIVGILQTGLFIFGGSVTAAVILAEMDGTRREQLMSILPLGVLLIPVVVAEAAAMETIETLLNSKVFHHSAGLIILVVAAETASPRVGECLPSPSIIIGPGLATSFESAGFKLIVTPDPIRLLSTGTAVGTGVGFVGAVVLFVLRLRGSVDIDLFRFGSSAALGMLALDVFDLVPTQASVTLGVLAVTALFTFGPGSDGVDLDEFVDDASATESATPNANANGAVADGGDDADPADCDASVDDANETDDDSEPGYGYPGEEESRTPWL